MCYCLFMGTLNFAFSLIFLISCDVTAFFNGKIYIIYIYFILQTLAMSYMTGSISRWNKRVYSSSIVNNHPVRFLRMNCVALCFQLLWHKSSVSGYGYHCRRLHRRHRLLLPDKGSTCVSVCERARAYHLQIATECLNGHACINKAVCGFCFKVDFTKCQGLFCVLGIVMFVTGIITCIVLSFKYVSWGSTVSCKHTFVSFRLVMTVCCCRFRGFTCFMQLWEP